MKTNGFLVADSDEMGVLLNPKDDAADVSELYHVEFLVKSGSSSFTKQTENPISFNYWIHWIFASHIKDRY